MSTDVKYVWSKLVVYKKTLVIIAISGLFYSLSKAYIAHYVKSLMDSATVPADLNSLAIVGVILALSISISRYFHIFLMNMVSEKVTQDIRQQLQQKFLKLNLQFHSQYASGSGGLLSRIFNDVKIVQDGLRLFADLFTAPFIFMGVLYNLFYFDKKLAVAILVVTPVILTILRKFSKTIKKFSIFGVEQLEKITSTIKESLDGVRTIQAFNLESFFKKKLIKQGNEFIEMRRKVHSRVELIGPTNEFVATLILITIFYYFSSRIASGQSSYGTLMAYLTTILNASEPIKKFQEAIVRVQESRVCADRITKLINEKSEVPEVGQQLDFPKNWQTIEYKNIDFSYKTVNTNENSSTLIKNFNLKITKGQKIAFVGESGSGKTTLANLLARFYDPQNGEILIDQTNIQDIKLSELRKNLALVSQDVFLFSDTVESNIIAGSDRGLDPNEVYKKLIEATEASHALEFITRQAKSQEKGLVTEKIFSAEVGERGHLFSGGEKQRLAIARAIYKNAPILILDEATSALDSVSEELVQQGLEKLMIGRTTLIIAHRLSTIQNADLIVVLKKGQIIEQGTHQQLIELNNEYAKLFYTQNQSAKSSFIVRH